MSKHEYQPHWVKGEIIKEGLRRSDDRYEAIKKFCSQYNRPFSVLDIGANFGYFSFRLASDFDCHVTMVEKDPKCSKQLQELCIKNELENVCFLQHKFSVKSLEALARVERFDVIIAMSVVHYFPDANEIMKIMRSMCDHFLVELPTESDAAHPDVVKKIVVPEDAQLIGEFETHIASIRPFYSISRESKVTQFEDKYFGNPKPSKEPMKVYSTFDDKYLIYEEQLKSRVEETHNKRTQDPIAKKIKKAYRRQLLSFAYKEMTPGINLMTYMNMGGSYPLKEQITDDIKDFSDYHSDVRPWNVLLTNKGAEVIDPKCDYYSKWNDRLKGVDAQNLKLTIEWILETEANTNPLSPLYTCHKKHYRKPRKNRRLWLEDGS